METVRKTFLYNKNEHDRNIEIRKYLEATFEEKEGKHKYRVKDSHPSRKSFLKLIGSSENKFNAVCKRRNAGINETTLNRTKPMNYSRSQMSRASTIVFIHKIRDEVAEIHPNELIEQNTHDKYFLPCGYTLQGHHQEYSTWCEDLRLKPLLQVSPMIKTTK